MNLVGAQEDELGRNRELILNLDDKTAAPNLSHEGSFVHYEGLVYYLNVLSSEIKVFDFKTGDIIESIGLDRFGPNSVGPEPNVFYLHSKDSLFVYSDFFDNRLSLVDGDGNIIKRFKLAGLDMKNQEAPDGIVPTGIGSFALLGRDLFVSRKMYSLTDLKRIMPLLRLDLENEQLEYSDAPTLYHEFIDRVPQLSSFLEPDVLANRTTGSVLVSYPLDHNIYASKDGFKTFQKHFLKSKFLSEKPRLLPKPITQFSGQNEYREMLKKQGFGITSGYYKNLIYNEDLNVYYRVAIIPHDIKEYNDYRTGVRNTISSTKYVVMTINEKFEVISEKVFSSKKFNLHGGLFMSPEGLWGLKHQRDNEDQLEFELLK